MSSFLGEVHFEEIPGKGRVRCVETGHELLAVGKESYGRSKKCRRALFDLCLAQRKSPLNVFEQSPTFKIKRKAKKGPTQPGVLKKKLRQGGVC